MARKKSNPTKISLAPIKAGGSHAEAAASAGATLRRFQATGYRRPEAPTPERMLQARGHMTVEPFSEVVEISRGDKFEPVAVDMVRIKVTDDQFGRIVTRGFLDRGDKLRNDTLGLAGIKYRELFEATGLGALRSVDTARDAVSGGDKGLWASEAQASAWSTYNAAYEAIPEDFRFCAEGIILWDRSAEDIGREVGAYRDAKMAAAVAMFILRRAVFALARHFKMLPIGDAAPGAIDSTA